MNKLKVYKFIVIKKMTPSLDTEYWVGGVTTSRDRYPHRVKNPIFLVRHMYPTMKVRESIRRRVKPAVRPRKFTTDKNIWDLVKTSEYQSLLNGF